MASKAKNIIIFLVIVTIFVLLYVFFIKKDSDEEASLVSASSESALPDGEGSSNPLITDEFLTLLLNVKGITLEDSLFSDPAFSSLYDSSIILIPDGTEGKPNPFAPLPSEEN